LLRVKAPWLINQAKIIVIHTIPTGFRLTSNQA
jgi:hypothetical protein